MLVMRMVVRDDGGVGGVEAPGFGDVGGMDVTDEKAEGEQTEKRRNPLEGRTGSDVETARGGLHPSHGGQ